MALRIRIEHGQDAGKTWRLGTDGLYRFGRSPQSSVQVLDMKVSKDHFEIGVDGAEGSVRDLGSSHGTLINGQKVPLEWKVLHAGDELRVGMTLMRVLSDGPSDGEAKCFGPVPTEGGGSPSMASVANGSGAGAAAAGGSSPPGTTTARTSATRTTAGAPRGLPPDALVGTTLAGYKVLQKVGAGGMGSVYRAEQLSLHREVALKVLAEKLVSDSAFVDQFVNEARAAGQLNHPNVVQVYDVGHADGRHFFSMEFIHGGSLEGKIPKIGGGVKWEQALPWFLDASNALLFAEKKGILHRDIKPDNFMLGQDGSVKLCDLGLAKKSESADLLAQGIIGTPHFIAPEAIRRKTDVDRRADLYSLGCTFYRLLTGKNPYAAGSVKEILLAHLNAPVPRVSALVTGVPKEVDDLTFRLMQKDPAARFQDSEELWAALDKIRLQHGMEAHGLHPGRAKKIAILGGLVAAAAIGVVIYTEPWKDKTKTVKETTFVEVGDKNAASKIRAANADSALSKIRVAAASLGRLEDGDNWKKAGWDDVVLSLDALTKNEEFKGTESVKEAATEAKRIGDYRDQRRKVADVNAAAAAKAATELGEAVRLGIEQAKEKASPPDADLVLQGALLAVDALAKRSGTDGSVLLAADVVKAKRTELEAARTLLLEKFAKEWTETAEGIAKQPTDSSAGIDAAMAAYAKWAEEHAELSATGPVARAWNDSRRDAESKAQGLRSRKEQARGKDLRADRGDYFSWAVKEAYTPRNDDGSGAGKYATFHFADAAESAAARAKGAKTPEYQALFARKAEEARLLATLPGAFSAGFTAKGYKDKVVGTGWSGTIKSTLADGLVVGEKPRPYAEEGLGWFYDLFYDKGVERFPLDANAHEALGYLAEAAGILEAGRPERYDQALAEWKKAAEADPSRKERLDVRAERGNAERAAKSLLDDSWALLEGVKAEMASLQADIEGPDAKKADAARKRVAEREEELKKSLVKAREELAEAEKKWPSTIGRALLVDTPPTEAAYAGETLPVEDPNPPQPHAGPGMGEAPATPAGMAGDPPPTVIPGPSPSDPGTAKPPAPEDPAPGTPPKRPDDPPPGAPKKPEGK